MIDKNGCFSVDDGMVERIRLKCGDKWMIKYILTVYNK